MSSLILDDLTVTLDTTTDCIVENLLVEKEIDQSKPASDDFSSEETIALDAEDIFVCGKCHQQFSSLKLFVGHKQGKCSGATEAHLTVVTDTDQQNAQTVTGLICEDDQQADGFKTQVLNNDLLALGDSSVVVSNADFLNLAINDTQVFTVNGVYQLSHCEDNKEMVSHLLQQDLMLASDGEQSERREETAIESLIEETPVEGQGTHKHKLPSKHDLPKAKVKQKCPYCGKEFTKNFDLAQHIRSHTGEKPFQCIVCGRAFAQKSNVKKHMNSHKVWPQDSLTNTLPKHHQADHGGKVIVDDSYVCSFCDVSFATYIELRSHMKSHNSHKVYKCVQSDCGETFVQLEAFVEHMSQHDEELQYRCHTCSKVFTSLHQFGFHQLEHSMYPSSKTKSGGPSYFRCTKCMKKYASAEALDYHLKTSSHNFPCQNCPKVFQSERLLRRHLSVHGNVSLIRCPTCGKGLRSVYSLKLHLMTHTGERPFACDVCKAAFNRKDQLKRHALIHQSKKLKCPFRHTLGCTREFRRPDKLQLHFMSHAKQKGKKDAPRKTKKRSTKSNKAPKKVQEQRAETHSPEESSVSVVTSDEPFDAPVEIIACDDFDLSFSEDAGCQMKKLEIVHIPLSFPETLIETGPSQVVVEDPVDPYLKNPQQMDVNLFVASAHHLHNHQQFDDT